MQEIRRVVLYRRRRARKPNRLGIILIGLTLVIMTILLVTVLAAGAFISATATSLAIGYNYFTADLPDPSEVGRQTEVQAFQTSKIYDRTGKELLYEIIDPQGGRRTPVSFDKIPQCLIDSIVVMEDKSFWTNPGFDFRRMVGAVYNTLRGEDIQGGSSITQQLIKNVIIPVNERAELSPSRKIKELILAWELSDRYPGIEGKKKILEWYLNTVFYGNLAYGPEEAAEIYFGKHVNELNLGECTMLTQIPQSPARNPIDNLDDARERQHLILSVMEREGLITSEEAKAAKNMPLGHPKLKSNVTRIIAPHFVDYVRSLLERDYGQSRIYRDGLKVYTTIDLNLQNIAEEEARKQIANLLESGHHASNASVVSINPRTGEILAMLGSINYFDTNIDGQVNVATSQRQPGSSIKPFTYLTSFLQGYSPATVLLDVRTVFPDPPSPPYAPENIDRKYHGFKSLRLALANSYNIPAVKLLDIVGIQNMLDTAHKSGITSLNRGSEYYGLSVTLGGGEVRLLDMAYAYSVFANEGRMAGLPVPEENRRTGLRQLDPVAILRVEDSQGNVLFSYQKPEIKQIIDPRYIYLLTNVLTDNLSRAETFGSADTLRLNGGRPAAVKTGSTNGWHDAWTIGYTPQLVTGVWVGNTDGTEMKDVPGSFGAAPIWKAIMDRALEGNPAEDFIEPPGISHVRVCIDSGLLPTENCPPDRQRTEIFIKGNEPTAHDNVYQKFRICKTSGKLATVFCPPDQVEEKVFAVYPPEAADYVRDNKIEQPPKEYDNTQGSGPSDQDVAITAPAPYQYIRGEISIIGNVQGGDVQFYRLQFGQGMDPSSWTQIGADHANQVQNNALESWDVSKVEEGLYTMQLMVHYRDGRERVASHQVWIDNNPPKIQIVSPVPAKVYYVKEDEWISLAVEAQDKVSMDRVVFFVDGQEVGTSSVSPYNLKWNLFAGSVGNHSVYVVGYDAAGNETKSESVRFVVRANR
ncbi:MAG: penicillin-binding protein [Chloroflexi bacterium]|nr:penicillin-binding protein [Chloroflexota bacterium]